MPLGSAVSAHSARVRPPELRIVSPADRRGQLLPPSRINNVVVIPTLAPYCTVRKSDQLGRVSFRLRNAYLREESTLPDVGS